MSLHTIEYKAPHILKAEDMISIARKATSKQYQPCSPIITCHIWTMSLCGLESIEFWVEAAWLLNTSHLICRLPVTMKIPLTGLRPRGKQLAAGLSTLKKKCRAQSPVLPIRKADMPIISPLQMPTLTLSNTSFGAARRVHSVVLRLLSWGLQPCPPFFNTLWNVCSPLICGHPFWCTSTIS